MAFGSRESGWPRYSKRESVVVYGFPAQGELIWAAEAQRLLEVIPAFVRGRVRRAVETYARERGLAEVTVEVMRQVRGSHP